MNANTTLGEVKAKCQEATEKHGNCCCEHCDFGELGCCDAPEYWQVEPGEAQPNWEAMFHESEEACRKMYIRCEEAERRADRMAEEIGHLRTIVSTVETMIGRKFDA